MPGEKKSADSGSGSTLKVPEIEVSSQASRSKKKVSHQFKFFLLFCQVFLKGVFKKVLLLFKVWVVFFFC